MNIKQKILDLKLPENSYTVVGSGILNALGIRESNDINFYPYAAPKTKKLYGRYF